MNWLLVAVFMAAVSLCPMSAWQRWLCLPGACRCGLCPANWSNYSTNICSLDLIFNKPSRYFYFLAAHPHKSAVPGLNSGEQRAVLTKGDSEYSFPSFFTILHFFPIRRYISWSLILLQLCSCTVGIFASCGREKETFRVNSTNSINIAIIGLISQKSPIYLHYLNQHRIGSNVYVKITPGDISAMYAHYNEWSWISWM